MAYTMSLSWFTWESEDKNPQWST